MGGLHWLRRTRARPIPAALAPAPRGLLPGAHLALDSVGSHVYWARSRSARGGLRLQDWGRLPLAPTGEETAALRALAHARSVRAARIEVALRSPGLKQRRLTLPPMSEREARAVAQRRLAEFLAEQGEECVGSAIFRPLRGPSPLWLVAAPAGAPPVFEQRWRGLGFELHRLSSEPLALGNLSRLLPPLAEGEVSAILDVHSEGADCVICDEHGWLFNRVIALQRGAAGTEGEESRPLEGRVVTELRRTLQYVQQELRLGRVARLALCGSHPQLAALEAALRAALEMPVGLVGSWIESGPARGLEPAAARAVGLALAAHTEGANLLPAAGLAARRLRRARRRSLLALTASALIALAAGARSLQQTRQLAGELAALRAELAAHAGEAQALEATAAARARAGALDQALAQLRPAQPALASWLEGLRRLAPPDVALADYQTLAARDGWQGVLLVEARADSVSVAAQRAAAFAESLKGVPLFRVASVERAPEAPEAGIGGSASVRFRIAGALAAVRAAPLAPAPAAPRASPEPRAEPGP